MIADASVEDFAPGLSDSSTISFETNTCWQLNCVHATLYTLWDYFPTLMNPFQRQMADMWDRYVDGLGAPRATIPNLKDFLNKHPGLNPRVVITSGIIDPRMWQRKSSDVEVLEVKICHEPAELKKQAARRAPGNAPESTSVKSTLIAPRLIHPTLNDPTHELPQDPNRISAAGIDYPFLGEVLQGINRGTFSRSSDNEFEIYLNF
jgi:hypothetical protein